MNISKAFPGSVTIEYHDEDWIQTIDYEHIPFHYKKCHEIGHLLRVGKNIPTGNSFDTLNHLPNAEEMENPYKPGDPRIDKGKSKQSMDLVLEKIITSSSPSQLDPEKELDEGGDTIMHMDVCELTDIDLEKLEDSFNKKELQYILVEQLQNVHNFFI